MILEPVQGHVKSFLYFTFLSGALLSDTILSNWLRPACEKGLGLGLLPRILGDFLAFICENPFDLG